MGEIAVSGPGGARSGRTSGTPDPGRGKSDADLGMGREITRRDFLDGVMIGTGAVLAGGWLTACEPSSPERAPATSTAPSATGPADTGSASYPPAQTGFAGQSETASVIPHQLRDGTFWASTGSPEATGETYDLVVVGAGISGLASAYFFAREHPSATILILDADRDIGGHARRNEFADVAGRPGGLLVGYGGSESMQSPALYSPAAKELIEDLGIDVEKFRRYYHGEFWPSDRLYVFDEELWGRDHVSRRRAGEPPARWVEQLPIAEQAKRDLVMLFEDPPDWMPGLGDAEKKRRLSTMSYSGFLREVAHVHEDAVRFLYNHGSDAWGLGIDGIGAVDVWPYFPGFSGMGMDDSEPSKWNSPSTQRLWFDEEPYIYHFPGGNSTIARLVLRNMNPQAVPGRSIEDEVLARVDYGLLDDAGQRVRVRLESPVVKVENIASGVSGPGVEITYAHGGSLRTVRSSSAVMACWYTMLPYVVEGLPVEQRTAAQAMDRVPLLYTSVQLRSRKAFEELDVWGGHVAGPGTDWTDFYLDYPVSIGRYEYPLDLAEPGIVLVHGAPTMPGLPPREGAVAGRRALAQTSFADLERSLRSLLDRALGPGGFDAAEDIQAITINRWAHGYTWEYSLPWDAEFYPQGPLPGQIASRRFGQIAFANTDRYGAAYADLAIDAAHDAIDDLKGSAGAVAS